MEEWYAFNQDKIRVISLITASVVLLFSIYRWLLMRWRSDVNLRKYAHFSSLKSSRISALEVLRIEVPEAQHIALNLESDDGPVETLYDQEAPVGTLKIQLDMSNRTPGDYSLVMQCADQHAMKKIYWSGLDRTQ